MLGSGPYVVEAVDPGHSVTLKRNPNYWGRDLPVNRGYLEFRHHPARLLSRRAIRSSKPSRKASTTSASRPIRAAGSRPMTSPPCATVGSSRRAFATACPRACRGSCSTRAGRCSLISACVRRLLLLFDFEWINKNLFFGQYSRTASYFDGSELSSHGVPASERERALLAPFPDAVAPGHPRRHLVAAGDATARAVIATMLRARARAARGGRLRVRRHAAAQPGDRRAVSVRDHGHDPRPGAARACNTRRT